jgi:hypothetical protein
MIAILLSVTAIGFCIVILFKFDSLKKEKITKEIKDNYVVLPKLKQLPNYNDVDPSSKTLYDVINSMKIENWSIVHYNQDCSLGDYLYEFQFSNPQKTLKVNSRLRYTTDYFSSEKKDFNLRLVGFHVISNDGVISYDEIRTNKDISILIKEYLWKIITDKNQDEYDEQFSHYLSVKESIDKELKTLRRDETLLNILGNEQR